MREKMPAKKPILQEWFHFFRLQQFFRRGAGEQQKSCRQRELLEEDNAGNKSLSPEVHAAASDAFRTETENNRNRFKRVCGSTLRR